MACMNMMAEPSAALYEKILSCHSTSEVGEAILEPLVESLEATSGVFMQIYSSPFGHHHFGARGYVGNNPASVDAYVEGQYALDPVIRPVLEWMEKETGPAPNLLTGSFERDLNEDAHYRDTFLRPFDIGHVVAVAMPMRTGLETQLACVGFHRRHGDDAFLENQLSYFRRLLPAVRSVLYTIACNEALALSEAIAMAAQEAGTDHGFLTLDEDLVVRSGNARALSDLDLTSANQGGSPLLGEIKQRLLTTDHGDDMCMHFKSTGSKPLNVEVRNFSSPEGRKFHLVTTSACGSHVAISDACRRFGLTDRETEIAHQVASGKCNASLSRDLGISLRTGENHLRSIFRKAGVSSRTQLISRLLQIN